MPPIPGPHANYNTDFAKAVIKAYVLGKKTFVFNRSKYVTLSYVQNVAEDVANGMYKIDVK